MSRCASVWRRGRWVWLFDRLDVGGLSFLPYPAAPARESALFVPLPFFKYPLIVIITLSPRALCRELLPPPPPPNQSCDNGSRTVRDVLGREKSLVLSVDTF